MRNNSENQARYQAKQKSENREAYLAYQAKKQREWALQNPEKTRAHKAVYRAVKKGVLVRATTCGRCGAECKTEASHDDYSMQLQVEWLCHPCHMAKDALARRESVV